MITINDIQDISIFLSSKGVKWDTISQIIQQILKYDPVEKPENFLENRKETPTVDPGSLNTGPDTTENVQEEYYWNDNYPGEGCNKNVIEHPDIFEEILEDMSETHRKKNHDYGDAAHLGYLEMGMPYYLGIIFNKYHRLKTLTLGKERRMVLDESVEDTLLDLANYAVLALESLKRDGQKQQGPVDA